MSELPAGGAWGASEASRGSCTQIIKSGGLLAEIPLGPLLAPILGLRAADDLCQHLTQPWSSRVPASVVAAIGS